MLAAADSIDDDLPIESAEPIRNENDPVDNPNLDYKELESGKLEIQITDAVSEKETIKFKVQVKTDLPSFVESRGREFKVERTHHEFSWLHGSLSENSLYAGYLIPPKPQKPDFSSPSKQLHDISEKEDKLPKEDIAFLKVIFDNLLSFHILKAPTYMIKMRYFQTDLEDKYLAQFKKAVSTHEIFLSRICQHKILRSATYTSFGRLKSQRQQF